MTDNYVDINAFVDFIESLRIDTDLMVKKINENDLVTVVECGLSLALTVAQFTNPEQCESTQFQTIESFYDKFSDMFSR